MSNVGKKKTFYEDIFKSACVDRNESAESDSDGINDSVVGNVSKLTVVPSGYTGKVKKGHLIFDACFESGNLGKVEYVSEYEYDLFIRPDTCNARFRVWFNFTVENTKYDQRVIFNVVNFSKTKSLYREGMSPVVKSSSRPSWSRISQKCVFYYRRPEHKKKYVMSFAFSFDCEEDVYQFAYCYPFTYSRLQAYLSILESKHYPHFKRELLGLTTQQRRLDLITITNPKNHDKKLKKSRIVFITARVHPGETPSSYVCQGFIDFMVSNHSVAQELREHLIFKIVPMLNPDGVYLGNYRSSLMGFDLNRQWQSPSIWAHPTIYATKQLLMKLDNDEHVDVNFFIDIHAHSTLMNGFIYGNIYEDEKRAERQATFPSLLSQFAEDFSLPQTNFNKDTLKAGTGRRTLGGILDDHTICYTLEVSFYSYTNMLTNETIPYTEEKYARLGRNLARTFYEYYSNEGLLCKTSSRVGSVHSPGNVSTLSNFYFHNNPEPSNIKQSVTNSKDNHSQSKHHRNNCHQNNYTVSKESMIKSTSSRSCLEDRLKYDCDQLKRLNQTLNSLSCRTTSYNLFSSDINSLYRSKSKDKS
ncbi:Cytosolic carboxypeptidase 6 [Schistosoma japonicum]|uniref:Cytosolic carboxypeptidase 6 n=1 Tax=Schistosoma japonicum TaxID=6182 RepID=A0A4Z2CYQ9_SCHJA|nr:Cytosolic carboxypeptidase 6 [Schistosoma japonicum]KAH8863935.1 Cytosolic carboxypeptidase 6 [Schistosoma japonicum]TNN09376.1 Cytosolic carboxypeptidase 6 [Schistosoma japonicum]